MFAWLVFSRVVKKLTQMHSLHDVCTVGVICIDYINRFHRNDLTIIIMIHFTLNNNAHTYSKHKVIVDISLKLWFVNEDCSKLQPTNYRTFGNHKIIKVKVTLCTLQHKLHLTCSIITAASCGNRNIINTKYLKFSMQTLNGIEELLISEFLLIYNR